jgi:hypothetical protein
MMIETTSRRHTPNHRANQIVKQFKPVRRGESNVPPAPLQFITLEGQPALKEDDKASRRLVKAQARRAVIRWQKLRADGSEPIEEEQQPSSIYSQKESTSKFKLSSWSRKPRRRKEQLQYDTSQKPPIQISTPQNPENLGLGNFSVIPDGLGIFNVLPIPFVPSTQRLLNYCKCTRNEEDRIESTSALSILQTRYQKYH